MSLEINLLVKKQGLLPSFEIAIKISRILAFGSLLIFVLLTIGVFTVQFLFTQQVQNILKQKEQVKKQIENLQATESLYLAYGQKLTTATELLKNRFEPALTLRNIESINPKGGIISSINLTNSTGNFSIVLTTDLETFDKSLTDLLNQKSVNMTNLTMSGLNRISANNYSWSYNVVMDNQAKKSP